MGYSLSWLAVRGRPAEAVRDELGLRPTGEHEETPEASLSAVEMPNGWYLIVSNRSVQVTSDAAMLRLSSSGCELVTCFVEEHVMVSGATAWADGKLRWSVTHDAQQRRGHLETQGELPPAFGPILSQLKAKQNDADANNRHVDFIFDLPVELAHSIVGYRYDGDVAALSGRAFEVLAGAAPKISAPLIAPEFRRRSLKKVTIGVLGCLVMAGLFIALALAGYMPGNPFMLIPAAIPFVYFCVGVIELLTGRPYQQLVDAWIALKGWQRGIIGTLIVLVAGFLVIVVITAVVMWFT